MKKVESDENKNCYNNLNESLPKMEISQQNVKSFKYFRLNDGKIIKLNWKKTEVDDNAFKGKSFKLFTIKGVEALIEVSNAF